jgi:hypothetical protein
MVTGVASVMSLSDVLGGGVISLSVCHSLQISIGSMISHSKLCFFLLTCRLGFWLGNSRSKPRPSIMHTQLPVCSFLIWLQLIHRFLISAISPNLRYSSFRLMLVCVFTGKLFNNEFLSNKFLFLPYQPKSQIIQHFYLLVPKTACLVLLIPFITVV